MSSVRWIATTAMVCTVPVVSSEDDPSPGPAVRPGSNDQDERARIEEVNAWRAARRGYLVFATDPERAPDEPGYREVFATEAKTPGEATAKVGPLAEGRRLRTFLATGTYKDELADARWVA
jgi:hypothetical protein